MPKRWNEIIPLCPFLIKISYCPTYLSFLELWSDVSELVREALFETAQLFQLHVKICQGLGVGWLCHSTAVPQSHT